MALVVMFSKLVDLYVFIIIIRALISWFEPNPYNPLYNFLIRITEPVMRPCRNLQFQLFGRGRFDFSAIIAIILLYFARNLIVSILI